MTRRQTTAALWIPFLVLSAAIFIACERADAPDYPVALYAAVLANTVFAGALLWRHGVSLATPVIIAIYVIATKWVFFLLFLSVIFYPKAAP